MVHVFILRAGPVCGMSRQILAINIIVKNEQ